MTALVLNYELVIRLTFFFGVLGLIAFWEFLAPRRVLIVAKWVRWSNNLALVVLNSFVLRLLFPAAAVGVAALSAQRQWGLLNYFELNNTLGIVLAIIILDFAIYLQHVMMHAVPLFWRLHRVHHADLDFDVTTGLRFHPIEIIVSMVLKFAVIAAIGAPVLAVVIFEILLNASSMFNHGNIRLPATLDRHLRRIIVTPDMHRVHHSIDEDETNSNFGFNLSLWDRLFGTYRDQPRAGHEAMTIGITTFRDRATCSLLPGLLAIPFKGKVTAYAINSRKRHTKKKPSAPS